MFKSRISYLVLALVAVASMALPVSTAKAVSTQGASTLVIDNTSTAATGVAVDLQPAVTASAGTGYGVKMQQTLTASANSDSLTALYINPTFTNGAFTGVTNNGLIVASGNVGFGVTAPLAALHVVSSGQIGVLAQRYGGIVAFAGRNSGGTVSVPTASSGFLTSFQGEGYDGTAYAVGGRMYVQAVETWSPSTHGTKLRLQTTPSGSTTLWDRISISAAGNVDIGATGGSDVARLIIGSNGTNNFTSWTTGGVVLQAAAATYTDTSSAASTTVANRVGTSWSRPTFASTNAVTVTDAATLYIANSPAAGTNTTITNSLALQIAAGNSSFGGSVGIGTTSPTESLDINADNIRIRSAKTPASATATCDQGEIAWDTSYVYVCVATNTWKRTAIATW